jgi:hypothetical protein
MFKVGQKVRMSRLYLDHLSYLGRADCSAIAEFGTVRAVMGTHYSVFFGGLGSTGASEAYYEAVRDLTQEEVLGDV